MTTTKNKIEPIRQNFSKNTKNKKKYIYNYKIDNNFLHTDKVINKNVNGENEGKREYHLDSWYSRGH